MLICHINSKMYSAMSLSVYLARLLPQKVTILFFKESTFGIFLSLLHISPKEEFQGIDIGIDFSEAKE